MNYITRLIFSVFLMLAMLLQLIELKSYIAILNLLFLLFFFHQHFFKNNFSLILKYNIIVLPLLFMSVSLYFSIKMSLDLEDLKCVGDKLNMTVLQPQPSYVVSNLSLVSNGLYEILYQLILNQPKNATMTTDSPILRVAQNGNMDLMHRLFVDLISTRRLSVSPFLQGFVNFTGHIVDNHSLPVFPRS